MNDSVFIKMVEWTCCKCGCIQMMQEDYNSTLRKNHNTFYCINGHAQLYTKKTDIEELEGKLMNEYAKNAQLEKEIERLKKSFINRIFPT